MRGGGVLQSGRWWDEGPVLAPLSYTVGAAVCYWKNYFKLPNLMHGWEGLPIMRVSLVRIPTLTHLLRGIPDGSLGLSWPSWPACSVCSCPSQSFHSPNRPLHIRQQKPPHLTLWCRRMFFLVPCTRRKTSVFSAGGAGIGISISILLQVCTFLLRWTPRC